jgi:phosphotransferase system HPr (HPr) family protein
MTSNKAKIANNFNLRTASAVIGFILKLTKYPVYIEKNDRRVNATSLLGLLSLEIKKGDEVLVLTQQEQDLKPVIEFLETEEKIK